MDKQHIKELRQHYMQHPTEGMTNRDIQHRNDPDLLNSVRILSAANYTVLCLKGLHWSLECEKGLFFFETVLDTWLNILCSTGCCWTSLILNSVSFNTILQNVKRKFLITIFHENLLFSCTWFKDTPIKYDGNR